MEGQIASQEGRRFGFTIGSVFIVLGGITWWRDHEILSQFLAGTGSLLFLGALITPSWLKPIERGWMFIALQISKLTTPFLMGITYFVVLTPIALVVRRIRGNPLEHSSGKHGYWFSSSVSSDRRTDMQRQF